MKKHDDKDDEEGDEENRKKVSEFVKKLEAKNKKSKFTQSRIDFKTAISKRKIL